MPSTVWYCHACDAGPFSTSYVPGCLECGHERCTDCVLEEIDTDSSSDEEDVQPDYGTAIHVFTPVAAHIQTDTQSTRRLPKTRALNRSPSLHKGPSSSLEYAANSSTSVFCFTPLEFYPTHASLEHGHHLHGTEPTDGGDKSKEYVWKCCHCHTALNSCRFNTHCTGYNCYHQRCPDCELEEIKK